MTIEPVIEIGEHDFAAAWHAMTARDPGHRASDAVDLAFWQAHALGYDDSATKVGSYERTLAAVQAFIRPNDTLLDVGAGTGRYALPLARSCRQVTALDHAAPMLDILQQKMDAQDVRNIVLREVGWDSAEIEPHDVVLAAWSLYRFPDIAASLQKLVAATTRTLIIITSPGNGLSTPPETPMHLYFYGALWQLGYHADLHIINEYPADSDQPAPVAMLVWQRPESQGAAR